MLEFGEDAAEECSKSVIASYSMRFLTHLGKMRNMKHKFYH